MKNNFLIILLVTASVLIIGVVIATIFDPSGLVSIIISTSTTIIGAVAIFFQYREEKEIDQFNFAITYFETFNESSDVVALKELIDAQYGVENAPHITTQHKRYILAYTSWIKSLSSLLVSGVLSYSIVDVSFHFKFFSFVNNPDIQELELLKYPNLYGVIFDAYEGWIKYLESIHKNELFETCALSKTEFFKTRSR